MNNKQELIQSLNKIVSQALAANAPDAAHTQVKQAAQKLAEALGLVDKPKAE